LPEAGTVERKTVLKTVRISESLARHLEKEAADEGVTVNADINAILSEHFEFNKKAREFGIASAPKSILMSLIEAVDDKEVARIGREVVPAVWKELAEFWSNDSSQEGILESLAMRSKFNPTNRTRVTRDEDTFTVVLHHDFGPKWSLLNKNALQEFVRSSFHVEPQMSVGESIVTARFKVNPRKSLT
jgi:hypothetical protein